VRQTVDGFRCAYPSHKLLAVLKRLRDDPAAVPTWGITPQARLKAAHQVQDYDQIAATSRSKIATLNREDNMRTNFLPVSAVAIVLCIVSKTNALADDWVVRVQSSSRACSVQLKTSATTEKPFKGPFDSRKKACIEAANQYDDTMTDQKKCWTYLKGTVDDCKKDDIALPPKKK